MDASRLAPIGSAFFPLVVDRWPEFVEHARVDEFGSLRIEYPSPHRPDSAALWISADAESDEVIVAFGGGHRHGGAWSSPGAPDERFAASVRLIEDLLSERAVACALAGGGGTIGDLERMRAAEWWSDVQSIRSWRGSLDRDVVTKVEEPLPPSRHARDRSRWFGNGLGFAFAVVTMLVVADAHYWVLPSGAAWLGIMSACTMFGGRWRRIEWSPLERRIVIALAAGGVAYWIGGAMWSVGEVRQGLFVVEAGFPMRNMIRYGGYVLTPFEPRGIAIWRETFLANYAAVGGAAFAVSLLVPKRRLDRVQSVVGLVALLSGIVGIWGLMNAFSFVP